MTTIPKGGTYGQAVASEDLVVLTKEEYDSLRRIAQSAQDMSDMIKAAGISVDGMTFGQAIDACRYRGAKIQRKNWNGIGQFVRYESVLGFGDGDNHEGEGPNIISSCFVFHFANRKTGETGIQVGWLASQVDMAANDWVIVE